MPIFRKYLEGTFLKRDEAGGDGAGGGGDNPPPKDPPNDPPADKPNDNPGDDPGDKNDPPNDDPPGDGLEGLDEKTKAEIKKLRSENARHRTGKKKAEEDLAKVKKALGLEEGDDVSPEDKLKATEAQIADAEFGIAVRDIAIEQGISGKDGFEYFEFLMQKEVQGMGEEEEISDERIAELVTKAKAMSGSGTPAKTSTSAGGNGKTNPPPQTGADGAMTVDDFAKMDFNEKGLLFGKNPELYKKLNAEAVAKNLL